jgi:hypothetical protein
MKKQKSDPRIVPYIYFSRLQRTARTRGIACKVTYKQIKTRLEQQDGRCALSGLPIGFALGFPKHRVGETTASLDRIDSASGYTCDNIQWVHKDINRLKNAFPQTRFFELCKAVTEHQNATSPNLSP